MGLVHEPKVLFLDEPTTGLDPDSRRVLWKNLERLRVEKNMTVLLTTHYLEEADYLCDRLVIIDRGKIVVEGTPDNLKSSVASDIVMMDIGQNVTQAISILNKIAGVKELKQNNHSIKAHVENGTTVVPAMIASLDREAIKVQSLRFSRPSLDDVYFKYTGQHFETNQNKVT